MMGINYDHNFNYTEFGVIMQKADVNKFNFPERKNPNASDIERKIYEISPSGYGIHWPLLDEDLSIDGLLGIKHTPQKIKEFAQV